MTAGILHIAPKVVDKTDALETLDSLRSAVEDGSIVAFCCVGIEPDDGTRMWTATTARKSCLQMVGAIHHLLHCYEEDL